MKSPAFTIRRLMVAIAILALGIAAWQEACFLRDQYGGLVFGAFAFLLSIILLVFSIMLRLAITGIGQAGRRPVVPHTQEPKKVQ